MNDSTMKIKLGFVPGLKPVVLDEIKGYSEVSILKECEDSIYIGYIENFDLIKNLRSVARAYVIVEDNIYHPMHVSKHKSLLGNLIEIVIHKNKKGSFKNFKITCAGSSSEEVRDIENYIKDTFKLSKKEEADLKIHIIKLKDIWEVGIQITPRPLSLREYKVKHMSGAMDPTIAYALNSLCNLENVESYLNVFSGSGTLMIEATLSYKGLNKIIGFDNNKEHLSLSIQNIKKAGLIRKIQVKEADVFDDPEFGNFDVIVADLPFGMAISKEEDLEILYKKFIEYSEKHLNIGGKMAIYTSEFDTFEKVVGNSNFKLKKELKINLITSEEQYLPTKIMVFELIL